MNPDANTFDVIVIGAGAAGMLAAGQAASHGARTVAIEKMSRSGRKLRITGKGRCNITNTASLSDFLDHIQPDGRFLYSAFSQFFVDDLIALLNKIGIETVVERGGRVFPVSQQAQDVVDALQEWVVKSGAETKTNLDVKQILIKDQKAIGIMASNHEGKQELFYAKKIILATGGSSYPATGSTGDGYRMAQALGHAITDVRPALVPLETVGEAAQQMQGLSLKNVTARVYVDQGKIAEEFGEMLFTHFGLSGPIILTLSRVCVDALQQNKKVELSIDLKPALDEKKLDARLIRDLNEHGKMQFRSILKLWLPSKMIPVCLKQLHIAADKPAGQISGNERKTICNWMKNLRFHVSGHRPFAEAIITAGGIKTKEIDPKTMESRIIKNLYFAGEVIDLNADTGGYNLQIAFSTGWLAGNSASLSL